ncbi:hypothetical protein WMF28_36960 [Sorangium sp. So ce590]|uniref:hypothetical protein n=1 Tax=Sorangium sp. So ce590 TaxID=3133317 RepID=UPI003F62B726
MREAGGERAEPSDPEVAGVPLSAYAAVLAYTAEGVSLDESLAHAAIPAGVWPAVEEAWSARLAESAMGDGALMATCDEHRVAAQAHVKRKVPPLDEELGAWLDFFRAFTASGDPLGFLGARGLGEGDVFRLLGFWQARIMADDGVRGEATAILAAAPGPVPEVRPEPPVLEAPARGPRGGAAAPAKKGPAAVVGVLGETADLADLPKLILPFVKPGSAPVVVLSAPIVRFEPLPVQPAPVIPPREITETAPMFSTPSEPALPFSSRAGEEVAQRSRLPAAAAPPGGAGASKPPVTGTAPVMFEGVKPSLPFAPSPGGAARSAAASVPRLSLEDYAAMLAEIAASPATATEIIARHGLTREAKRVEDAAWQARFAAEPALRMEWMRELVAAGERVRGKR